ncbi:hypothetical protein MMC31_006192 [Peltigera leucophlebia]|nr:hypothetical protein [Peltigera leucophlebia]
MAHSNDLSECNPLLSDSHRAASYTNTSVETGPISPSANAGQSDTENVRQAGEEIPTTLQLLMLLGGPWLGSFLAALDGTIIATLSVTISASFHSFSMLSWIVSSYLIASAAVQPVIGRLTDILSRKTGLLVCIIIFTFGNLICGLAKSQWVMVFGRAVAGAGGGGINAVGTFLGSDYVPLRRRGVWQGMSNVVWASGVGLGGVVGGVINDRWGWRVAFLMLVPLTILSGVWVIFFVPSPPPNHKKPEGVTQEAWERIDFLGAFTLIATLIFLFLGLNTGGNVLPWTHPLVLASFPLSVFFFCLFIYVENSHAKEPIIPLHLLLNRTVLSACLVCWIDSMLYYSLIFYGPVYLQIKHFSPTKAGLYLTSFSLGSAIGSISAGLIMRKTGKYYFLSIFIQATLVSAFILASSFFSLASPDWIPIPAFFLCGFGFVGTLTVTLTALISAVDQADQAVATSASYAFRSTGSTIGITISSSVFQNILHNKLWALLGDHPDAAEIISRLKDSLDEIWKLPRGGWQEAAIEAYMFAVKGPFLTMLGFGVLGMVISLGMRENVLYNTMERK